MAEILYLAERVDLVLDGSFLGNPDEGGSCIGLGRGKRARVRKVQETEAQ